jgi:hypothetical protein
VGTLEMYGQVPLIDDITYGLGAVILALTEASGMLEWTTRHAKPPPS